MTVRERTGVQGSAARRQQLRYVGWGLAAAGAGAVGTAVAFGGYRYVLRGWGAWGGALSALVAVAAVAAAGWWAAPLARRLRDLADQPPGAPRRGPHPHDSGQRAGHLWGRTDHPNDRVNGGRGSGGG